MKRHARTTVLMIAVLALSLIPFAAATCGTKGGGRHGCPMYGEKGKCAPMKDASMKVENLTDGVKITLTSDKPEAVKALQDCATKCSAKGEGGGMCLPVKGAKVETVDLTNGVEIHLTSDKPETVKALQEHAARCSARHEKGEAGVGCAKMGHGMRGHATPMDGAKVEVKSLPNGATITITSEDPEVVKAIQAHAEGCSAMHEKKGE
jgi:TusA-related sulfurtransferase